MRIEGISIEEIVFYIMDNPFDLPFYFYPVWPAQPGCESIMIPGIDEDWMKI
jgi:hypothetical protein